MEHVQFNLVGGPSQKKKASIIIGLMTASLLTTAISAFVLKNMYIMVGSGVVFFGILYFLKYKFSKIIRIGTMTFGQNSVELHNPQQGASRSIAVSSIDSVSLRNGIKANEDDTREFTTMYLDFHLKTGENLPVHLEVTEIDEHTQRLVDDYFEPRKIEVNRKL